MYEVAHGCLLLHGEGGCDHLEPRCAEMNRISVHSRDLELQDFSRLAHQLRSYTSQHGRITAVAAQDCSQRGRSRSKIVLEKGEESIQKGWRKRNGSSEDVEEAGGY